MSFVAHCIDQLHANHTPVKWHYIRLRADLPGSLFFYPLPSAGLYVFRSAQLGGIL